MTGIALLPGEDDRLTRLGRILLVLSRDFPHGFTRAALEKLPRSVLPMRVDEWHLEELVTRGTLEYVDGTRFSADPAYRMARVTFGRTS
ncbi:MAG: hypothetical protein AAFZ87_04345 [Planctomycetota bacterium]